VSGHPERSLKLSAGTDDLRFAAAGPGRWALAAL
jgi:hypothetical protein